MESSKELDAVSFSSLNETDFELMYKWLNTDFVKRWYSKRNWTFDEIVENYTPYIQKQKLTGEPVESFTIVYEGKKIGYIQTYLLKDYPEYNMLVQPGDGSSGIDLFIGEREYLHKGLGSKIIRKFIREKIFCNTYINKCVIGPEPGNAAAIRAYEKAGFRYVKTIQVPDETEPEYIMELLRTDME